MEPGVSEHPLLTQLHKELMANSLVNEVTRAMLAAPSREQALKRFVLGVAEITSIDRLVIFRMNTDGNSLEPEFLHGWENYAYTPKNLKLDAHHHLFQKLLENHHHCLIDSVEEDDPFFILGISSYILVPVMTPTRNRKASLNSELMESPPVWKPGTLQAYAILWMDLTNLSHPITGHEISHVATLSQQAAMVMENFAMYRDLQLAFGELESKNSEMNRLYTQLQQAHKLIELDLDHARTIQKNLLPEKFPEHLVNGAATYIPANKVGGDYYDCFEVGDGDLAIVVADVAGHGMAAAMIMSMFKVLLKSYANHLQSPAEILRKINQHFLKETKGTHFVTAFYGMIKKNERSLTYCSAGHPPQLIDSGNGEFHELGATGLFVGVFDEPQLEDKKIVLQQKGSIVLYTDGITEASNPQDEMFGFNRLENEIKSSKDHQPSNRLDKILQSLHQFRQNKELADDITLVVLDL